MMAAPFAPWEWGSLLPVQDIPPTPPASLFHAHQALVGGTRGALYSPLQEHGLQQEALGGRVGCTLSPHVLLYIASQVLRMGQTHLMNPLE